MIKTYPSADPRHRKADLFIHILNIAFIVIAGMSLLALARATDRPYAVFSISVYTASVLGSYLASMAYHFLPLHDKRPALRRVDHAAIYISICGTFTPLFLMAGNTLTLGLLCVSWALAIVAFGAKILMSTVETKWSLASYLALGSIGIIALPTLENVPMATVVAILIGSLLFASGTVAYAKKDLPFRYGIWHGFVGAGAAAMCAGIWIFLRT